MNGIDILADTNILIYLTSGNKEVASLLANKQLNVSEISEIECLSFKGLGDEDLSILKDLFESVSIIKLNDEIKKGAIELKKQYSLKLPDAIIAATSQFLNCPLISADKKF